jgi:N-acylglucosamine 2-epimerase
MNDRTLTTLAGRYKQDLYESVLPFWMRHSPDRENGGFFTCLGRDGTLYDDRKYVWLNGRQVWMLSKLYNTVEKRDEWIEAAGKGAAFLRRHGRDAQGRVYFALTREGAPAAYQRKPYGAVFMALGLLEYSKATGDAAAGAEARDLFWRIREWIADPALMGRLAFSGPKISQLADIMVVTSLALELAEADPDDVRYPRVLADCIDAALRHCEPNREILIENAGADGRFLTDTPEGRLFCPGHAMEVCWFLLHALEYHPDAARQERILRILENSLLFGWDEDFGGLQYFIDIQGRPPLQLEAPMKLWWPHTEAIYSLILAYTMTGQAKWLRWLEMVDDYTYRTFPDPMYGEWFGYCDRRGRITHSLKGNNYKGCFHVPRALWLSIREIEGR